MFHVECNRDGKVWLRCPYPPRDSEESARRLMAWLEQHAPMYRPYRVVRVEALP